MVSKPVSTIKPPTTCEYSTGVPLAKEKRADLRLTMFKKLVRLPSDAFMSKFVPYSGDIPDDAWFFGMFDSIPKDGLEADIQDQMVSRRHRNRTTRL